MVSGWTYPVSNSGFGKRCCAVISKGSMDMAIVTKKSKVDINIGFFIICYV
jgi:hypothetical protein